VVGCMVISLMFFAVRVHQYVPISRLVVIISGKMMMR
jgi:hypothetical protein